MIDVRSDRYVVKGGPGDLNHYFGHRAEYICRGGVQEFEMLNWIFGEAVEMRVPKGVKVLAFGVRESSYDCDVIGRFECDDERVNKLFEKSVQTLRVCMRENYMDYPDRERGQWIGDVSVQAPQIAYLLDKNALKLLRKAIFDFIQLRKGDRLVGNVPGDNFCELPGQSLNAISEWGMIASYYAATGDRSVLEVALEPSINYLKLWQTDGDGMLLSRKGDWAWFDHLYNIDIPVLEHCWYYSALKFVRFMAVTLKKRSICLSSTSASRQSKSTSTSGSGKKAVIPEWGLQMTEPMQWPFFPDYARRNGMKKSVIFLCLCSTALHIWKITFLLRCARWGTKRKLFAG